MGQELFAPERHEDMVEKVIKRKKGRSYGEAISTNMLYSKRHEEIRINKEFFS